MRIHANSISFVKASLYTALTMLPAWAVAQEGEIKLEEIVVTAQRRSESLATTPVAVAFVSAERLAKGGITGESDLTFAAPGLLVQGGVNSNQLNYVIRGQATEPFSGIRPGVLPYFNEVQISSPGGSSAFYDLESVQVLKGPQGTLFGRNSTGGAVLFTTAKPTEGWGGYASAAGGDYNFRRGEAAINVPIIPDVVLGRVAAFAEKRDGYQYNMYSDQHVGNADRYGVRGSLTIKPADGIENNTVVDYFSADETNTAAVIWNVDPTQLTTLPVGVIYSPALDQIVFSGAWNAYLAGHPKADPNGLPAFLLEQRSRGPFTIDSQGSNSFRADNLVTTNITTIDIGGNTLKNVLGYGHFKYDNPNASFGVPYVVNNQFSNVATNEQFSEELQWQAKAFDDKLNYTTGFFYNRETSDNSVLTDVIEFLPFQPDFNVHHIWGIKSKTYAAYAQGTYDLSDATGLHGLAATLGARYTNEKVALANRPGDDGHIPALTDPTQAVNQEQTFKNVSWVARLEEQLNDQVLIYTTVRKAYRNGGYNGVIAPVIGDGTDGGVSYKTQTVTDVELGFKFEGHLGEMPTRLNLAGFNSWIKDDQRVAYTFDNFGNPGAITVNVPKARVRGVEFDSNIRLTQWLEIGAVANYTDAEFTDDKVSILGRPPVEFGTYPYAPEFSGSVFAELTFPVAAAMQLTVRGEEYYQSSMFFSSTGNLNPGSELPEYATTNFQVGLENPDAGWSVVANLKNAFNRVYYTGGVSALQLFQVASTVPGAPRTLRVEARYKF